MGRPPCLHVQRPVSWRRADRVMVVKRREVKRRVVAVVDIGMGAVMV
jgi:hypothetical protein